MRAFAVASRREHGQLKLQLQRWPFLLEYEIWYLRRVTNACQSSFNSENNDFVYIIYLGNRDAAIDGGCQMTWRHQLALLSNPSIPRCPYSSWNSCYRANPSLEAMVLVDRQRDWLPDSNSKPSLSRWSWSVCSVIDSTPVSRYTCLYSLEKHFTNMPSFIIPRFLTIEFRLRSSVKPQCLNFHDMCAFAYLHLGGDEVGDMASVLFLRVSHQGQRAVVYLNDVLTTVFSDHQFNGAYIQSSE